ncbi:Sodium channel protein Nach [Dufourea novaeangliae]|uniref:Sodium channel protein Nach n=2 Tax=Dufourea novaeangliae TaxID=178035 RepID=A0A154NXS5_DUFNO|nr:Sodium channel protein Nach [Dufourea novaeangliae]
MIMTFTYDHYSGDRLSSVVRSTHHGIWHYPFPAVTMCDFNRVSLELTWKLVEKLKLPPSVSKEFIVQEMRLLNELLYPGRNEGNIRHNLSRLQNIFDANDLSIPMVIKAVTRNCESMMDACRIKTENVNCNELFEPSLSRDGLCCSFNYITRENSIGKEKDPLTMTSCGYQSGLTVLVNFNPDDYHATIVESVGIKVMLHDPYDYPGFDATTKLIAVNKYSFLTIQPEATSSTGTVRSIPLATRTCAFMDEIEPTGIYKNVKRKSVFAKYSFRNCLTECRASVIKTKCGCIPYYYSQNDTRVCNLKDVDCLNTFKYWYTTAWPGIDLSPKTLPTVQVDTKHRSCGCKPDCDFYHYSVENSVGTLHSQMFHHGLKYTNNIGEGNPSINQSIIHVFFGDLVSLQYRRDVRYSWRRIFATFGGLFGLFVGFNLMSIFEFVYFFVIRIITDVRTKTKNGKQKT